MSQHIPKKVTIGTKTFAIYMMPPRRVLAMQRLLSQVLTPLLGAIGALAGGVSKETFEKDDKEAMGAELIGNLLSGKMDMDQIGRAMARSMSAITETEYDMLICGMLNRVQWCDASNEEGGAHFLETGDLIDRAFIGSPNDIYKLIIEVVGYNKMLPFELAGIGSKT